MEEMDEPGAVETQHAGADFNPNEFDPEDFEPRPFTVAERRHALWVLGILVLLVMMALLPPLVNMNRFRRQITSSISLSLGRPVHLDSVTLDLLPLPGFTLQNFFVSDDPAFSSEPVIHANSVKARLRWRSMWRGRVEFSRISLTEPSVNLVYRAGAPGQAGSWNVESILLQASRMPAAPTAQKGPGSAPRFPYIEATSARVNLKMGLEKMPLALTDADFALWLPKPGQWHLRLEGHPSRTDTASTDTGTFRIEGTLGHAARLDDVPLDLQAAWINAPLGGASWVLMGRDAGFRGDLNLTAGIHGPVGDNSLETHLAVTHLRRADFVPTQTLDLNLQCNAQARGDFHRLEGIRCSSPAPTPGSGLSVTGALPDVSQPRSAAVQATVRQIDAGGILQVLRLASSRISPGLKLAGTVSADLQCCAQPQLQGSSRPTSLPAPGTFSIAQARLTLGDTVPFVNSAITGTLASDGITLQPLTLDLGAPMPATLEGRADSTGYTFHLTGSAIPARLLQLAGALPPLGDGIAPLIPASVPPDAAMGTPVSNAPIPETPIHLDLISHRRWTGPQSWMAAPPVASPSRRRASRTP